MGMDVYISELKKQSKSLLQIAEDSRQQSELSEATDTTAKSIREVLKKNFPKTKFSVKTQRGGMSIAFNVSWTDSIPQSLVDKVVNNYESYKRDERSGEILSGGNTYVFTKRIVSDANMKKIRDFVDENFQAGNLSDREVNSEKSKNVWKIAKTMDFDKPFKIIDKFSSGGTQWLGNLGNDSKFIALMKKGLV